MEIVYLLIYFIFFWGGGGGGGGGGGVFVLHIFSLYEKGGLHNHLQ